MWLQPFIRRVHDDFSPKDLASFVSWMERRTRGQLTFGVVRGGELGGLVWFESANGIHGVVHSVFKKTFWGRKTTATAFVDALDRYFATGAEKCNSVFFTDNRAVRAVAKDFGFTHEGTVRAATKRNGELADIELWGVTKEEWTSGNRNSIDFGRRIDRRGRVERARQEKHVDNDADLHAGPAAHPEDPGQPAATEDGAAGSGHGEAADRGDRQG